MAPLLPAGEANSAAGLRTGSTFELVALGAMLLAGFMGLNSFAIMQESAKADLGLTDTLLGLVQGLGTAVPLVVFSIPVGILVDRRNRVRLVLALVSLWTLGTLLTAFAANVATMFVARMIVGIGTTGALTAALSLCADLAPPDHRGRAMLIVSMGKSFGQAAAFAVPGWLLALFASGTLASIAGLAPWRAAQLGVALVGALFALPLLKVREPARHEVESAPGAPFAVIVAELWRRRAFLAPLFVGQTGVVMADAAGAIWAAPVLIRNYHLQPSDFAGWLGAILLVVGIAGAILGGILADWGKRLHRRDGLLVPAIAGALIGVPAALFPVMPGIPGFAVMLGLLMLAGTITGLVTSVALTVYIPNELRGLSIGAFVAIAGLIGFGVAPPSVAALSGLLGGEQHLDEALAIVGVVVGAVSVAGFVQAMRQAPGGQPA